MITSITELKELFDNSQTELFIRWSRGIELDKEQGQSRDYASQATHAGLSAVQVEPYFTDSAEYLARRVTEYWFLKMKDSEIGCHIYTGRVVGLDSDGYESIKDVELVGTLSNALVRELLLIKNPEWAGKLPPQTGK